MQRPTLTVLAASFAASATTLLLALAPALDTPAADATRVVQLPRVVISAPRAAARVVELPRVVVSAAREVRVVELPRVTVQGRRDTAQAANAALQQL